MRYYFLTMLCALLRHPTHTKIHTGGSSHTRCLCEAVNVSTMPMHVRRENW